VLREITIKDELKQNQIFINVGQWISETRYACYDPFDGMYWCAEVIYTPKPNDPEGLLLFEGMNHIRLKNLKHCRKYKFDLKDKEWKFTTAEHFKIDFEHI